MSFPEASGQRVGLVIIGRNEGERLVRSLRSLSATRGAVVAAVVYVDSASTDGSVARAREAGAIVVPLDVSIPFTAARARNEGWTALVRHDPELEFVQFIDGDCELDPDWLAAGLAFLAAHPEVAVVCGRRRERFPGASPYNRLCDMEWNTPVGQAEACGGDSLMRMAALQAAGGFRSAMMAGEEPELCARLRAAGWRIWRLDAEMTIHDAAMTRFGQWWMRGVRSGFGYAQVWSGTRDTAQPLYGRELARTVGWGAVLPAAIFGGALLHPALGAAGFAVYAAQIARVALRTGPTRAFSWRYGALMVISKFAEFQGLIRFLRRQGAKPASSIEYKAA